MRILFVGNYDIAGKYLALRLYKEGHRISWLTEETEKELWEPAVKGSVYRYTVDFQNCYQIIRTESPECIIFLTQASREAYGWNNEMLMKLQNTEADVLRAAATLGVRKIIYLSSRETAEDGLLNPAFEKLRAGERLCQSVCRADKMECLIVRTGIVYGETPYEDQGFLGSVIKTMYEKKRIYTQYRSVASFDFIYGSDLADAVERLIAMEAKGIHTVTTGYPVQLSRVYDAVAAEIGYRLPVTYGNRDHEEKQEDCVAFKRYSGWMPFYVFDKEIQAVVKDAIYLAGTKEKKKEKSKKEKKEHSFFRELLENLLLFAGLTAVSVFSSDWSDIRFVDVKLFYVVIIAISFGMKQGMIATVLASFAYIFKLYTSDVDLAYITYSIDTWIPFIIYGLAGASVGYITDKRNDDAKVREDEYQNLGERYSFLKDMYQEVINIKNQLQKQIMISRDSLAHIYEITEELNTVRPRTVMFRTVKVVEETMECSSVAIYVRAGKYSSYGRLMACSGDIAKELKASINFNDFKSMEEVLLQNEMFVNTEMLPDYPGFAMPVFDGENMAAVVALYKLDPDKYTVYYKNFFKTLILIMRSCLIRAYNYQEDNRDRIYIENTNILNYEEFEAEREAIVQTSEELQYPFSLGRIVTEQTCSYEEWAKLLGSLIRGTDIVGCDRNGDICIILLFVTPSLRSYTEKRFTDAGLQIKWEN